MSSPQQVPAGMRRLLRHYEGKDQPPVQFRPATWERALHAVNPAATALLRDERFTDASEASGSAHDDRLVTRDGLRRACAESNLDNPDSVTAAFALVMAWGSGLTGGRGLRNTARALGDNVRVHALLRDSARTLRQARDPEDGALASAHRGFRLPGVRQPFFSKWFAFAGYRDGREWQPLILDSRVYASLNETLNVSTKSLAGSRRRADRYVAYVAALHAWARQVGIPGATGERLEWILFRHRGHELPA